MVVRSIQNWELFVFINHYIKAKWKNDTEIFHHTNIGYQLSMHRNNIPSKVQVDPSPFKQIIPFSAEFRCLWVPFYFVSCTVPHPLPPGPGSLTYFLDCLLLENCHLYLQLMYCQLETSQWNTTVLLIWWKVYWKSAVWLTVTFSVGLWDYG